MRFRFIHTADWQIGKPFGNFEDETKFRLQEERYAVIDRIAETARTASVTHVLVAGDVFDHVQPADRVLRRTLDRLSKAKDIYWWLLPGNHDPSGPNSLWQRLSEMGIPNNVHPLLEPRPVMVEDEVAILPAPWTSKHPNRDLTAWFESPNVSAEVLIGLAHGSVQGFGSDPDPRALIPSDRSDRSSLAYLALGDWHGTKRAGPRAFYSGTPEPDSFRNNERGQVLLVDTENADAPETIRVGGFDWLKVDIVLHPEQQSEPSLDAVLPTGVDHDRTLLNLSLSGNARFSEKRAWETFLAEQAQSFAHLAWSDDALDVVTAEQDLADLLGEGALRNVAQALVTQQESGNPAALDALNLLDLYARQ
ncbi:MAG: DNA repair exonuclease [Pseudomonadota bacterium]